MPPQSTFPTELQERAAQFVEQGHGEVSTEMAEFAAIAERVGDAWVHVEQISPDRARDEFTKLGFDFTDWEAGDWDGPVKTFRQDPHSLSGKVLVNFHPPKEEAELWTSYPQASLWLEQNERGEITSVGSVSVSSPSTHLGEPHFYFSLHPNKEVGQAAHRDSVDGRNLPGYYWVKLELDEDGKLAKVYATRKRELFPKKYSREDGWNPNEVAGLAALFGITDIEQPVDTWASARKSLDSWVAKPEESPRVEIVPLAQ